MRSLRSCLLPLVAAFFCIPTGGCKAGNASGTWPKVLTYAYSPQADQLQSAMRASQTKQTVRYLESQLHIPVDLVQVQGYAPTIEAMRADKVDIAHFGALSYLIAAQKAGAVAIVARGYANGELGGYHSVIAVPKDSPYHTLADLKAHAKDIVFAFADPASTSGDLYPRVELQDIGIDPEKDFKQVLYANGHLADMLAIETGKVDAGAFDQVYMTHMIQRGRMKPGDIRVLWTSGLIPNEPIAVRKALPDQLKKEIQTAFLDMRTKAPQLWASMNRSVFSSTAGTIYIPVADSTYDGLRHYAMQVKQFNFLEK